MVTVCTLHRLKFARFRTELDSVQWTYALGINKDLIEARLFLHEVSIVYGISSIASERVRSMLECRAPTEI